MDKIGDFQYPSLTTFTETFDVAKECVNKYGGFMPNIFVTSKLGYTFKNANQISGWIYKRIDDMASFGLFTRERGGIRITDLGKEATDPYDSEKARKGKTKAIYKFPIFERGAKAWNFLVPNQDAFPAKLGELTSMDWTEARKHSETLQKLISDAFLHLKPSIEVGRNTGSLPAHFPMPQDRGEISNMSIGGTSQVGGTSPFGEVRTIIGTVVITDSDTLKLAQSFLDVLATKIEEQKRADRSEKTKASKEEK